MPANVRLLRLFGPVLIVTGVLGFLLPPQYALMSGAAPYDVFHIAFGIFGTLLAFRADDRECRRFNVGFGLIDLYQAAAHALCWFPMAYFRWTRGDDVAHVVLGLLLVGVGASGARTSSPGST